MSEPDKIDDGGPAFPQCQTRKSSPGLDVLVSTWGGMTLRDYFAAHALQGLMADSNVNADCETLCHAAYQLADGMLKVRKE